MRRDVYEDIKNLEFKIIQTEEQITNYLRAGYNEGVKTSLHHLNSDLKYLSVLANGAPINKEEDRRIMDFLRIHYEQMKKLSLPV